MLILSRKTGQSFYVGDEVEIVILESQGERVKIGIHAPASIKLVRRELRETEQANQAAAQSAGLAWADWQKAALK